LFLNRGANTPAHIRYALAGIQNALYADDVPEIIQSMFNAQAQTTCRSIYLEYSYGTRKVKENGKVIVTPGIVVKEAADQILESSKHRAVNSMLTKIRFYTNSDNSKIRDRLKQKYGIVFKDNKLEFYVKGKKITATYDSNNKIFTIVGEDSILNSSD
jgi:hypothetical protein